MSGFEAIGIVLGALPLIISALEGYQKLGKKRDAFKRRSLHIDRMKHVLSWQNELILGDVRIVLRNAGLEGVSSDTGTCQSFHKLLSDPAVQEEVEDYLGSQYGAYLEVVGHCEGILLEIVKAIGSVEDRSWTIRSTLGATLHASPNLTSNESDFWKGVKFSMNKEAMDSAILDLERAGRTLERLREKSQQWSQVDIQTSSASSRSTVALLRKVQSKALALYRALTKSWNGHCHDAHFARLYLEHRGHGSRRLDSRRRPKKGIDFAVAFEGVLSSRSDIYHMCAIEVQEAEEHTHLVAFRAPTVRFKTSPDIAATDPDHRIEDMCQVLKQSLAPKDTLRLYLHEGDQLKYSCIPSEGQTLRASRFGCGTLISLEQLFSPQFSIKARLKTAALVASSARQLHSTPWCTSFRKESLKFVQNASGDIDLENPLVACQVINSQLRPLSVETFEAESALLDIGILIMELWHNYAIHEFAAKSGLNLRDNFESRQQVARRWMSETKDELLNPVYEAAFRCIGCRFDAVDIDFNDVKLSISIFEGVVKPLWDLSGGSGR